MVKTTPSFSGVDNFPTNPLSHGFSIHIMSLCLLEATRNRKQHGIGANLGVRWSLMDVGWNSSWWAPKIMERLWANIDFIQETGMACWKIPHKNGWWSPKIPGVFPLPQWCHNGSFLLSTSALLCLGPMINTGEENGASLRWRRNYRTCWENWDNKTSPDGFHGWQVSSKKTVEMAKWIAKKPSGNPMEDPHFSQINQLFLWPYFQ